MSSRPRNQFADAGANHNNGEQKGMFRTAYVRTLESPEKTLADARRERAEAKTTADHEKALAAARHQFDSDFRDWRVSRPEYRKLVAAVRREASDSELQLLGVAAGCGPNDWISMCEGRRRALFQVDLAKTFDQCKQKYDALERQYREIDARYPLAKNQFESDAILDEIQPVAEQRQKAMLALVEAEMAHNTVRDTKAAGLI